MLWLRVSASRDMPLRNGLLKSHAVEEEGLSKFGYAAKGGTFQAISAKLKYSPIRDSASRVMLGRMLRCPASKVMVRM